MIKRVNTCKRVINACTVQSSGKLAGVMVDTTGVVGTDRFDAAETAWTKSSCSECRWKMDRSHLDRGIWGLAKVPLSGNA
uniref:Uncharacterized protein n=1 Tax=Cannabis sativa TaxID=3483 RepID=A0A803Q8Z4_CANSA